MQTLAKITHYSYKRKIFLEDRGKIVELYALHYSISRIAQAAGVTTPTIRHHLQAEGVLEKDRKPQAWNQPVPRSITFKSGEIRDEDHILNYHWPKHIQEIYKKMHKEDEEMRLRIHCPKKKNIEQHRGCMADSEAKIRSKRVPVMISITL